jgi:integrase
LRRVIPRAANDYETSSRLEGDNPARWKGNLEALLSKKSKIAPVTHHAALPYAELPTLMVELRQAPGVPTLALEFLILTAARAGEVLGATWAEIDFANRLWVIPATRMKAGREHRVPLSAPALSILEAMAAIRSRDHVFPGQRSGRPLSSFLSGCR